jgi:DNA modification methylase
VAALKMGRRFIGIEIDAGYAAVARRRIAEAAAHLFA